MSTRKTYHGLVIDGPLFGANLSVHFPRWKVAVLPATQPALGLEAPAHAIEAFEYVLNPDENQRGDLVIRGVWCLSDHRAPSFFSRAWDDWVGARDDGGVLPEHMLPKHKKRMTS